MHGVAPAENDSVQDTLEKRFGAALDPFRGNPGLKFQEYSAPVLGPICLRFGFPA